MLLEEKKSDNIFNEKQRKTNINKLFKKKLYLQEIQFSFKLTQTRSV